MVSNDDFDGKATHLNFFYLHINFEQKYPKPAIVFGGEMGEISLKFADWDLMTFYTILLTIFVRGQHFSK